MWHALMTGLLLSVACSRVGSGCGSVIDIMIDSSTGCKHAAATTVSLCRLMHYELSESSEFSESDTVTSRHRLGPGGSSVTASPAVTAIILQFLKLFRSLQLVPTLLLLTLQ